MFVVSPQDALHSDVVEALMTSTNSIVSELFDPVAGKRAVKVRGGRRRRVGTADCLGLKLSLIFLSLSSPCSLGLFPCCKG